ncbi:MAG TPA: polyprenyl synthetase family protein [Polyangiales bacterium]
MSSPSAPIASLLADIKLRVDAHLTKFFEQKRAHARTLSAPSVELVDALAEFTMRGGKRTRPAILIAGHDAVAGSNIEPLLDACAGLELLQSYLLVHDDWMDQDAERRGGITLHKLFGQRLNDAHLGASLAILGGDLGNAFAIELVARSAGKSPYSTAALEVFWTMQRDVVYGQALDLIAYRDVALIQRLKTGSYSVKGPLLLGAVLGGASKEQCAALEKYAEPAGLAFQMRDDVLGVFGAPEKTGKPAGNDLRAGKHTALIEEAQARLSEQERAPLTAVLGKADATDGEIAAAMQLLVQCGAQAAVETRIEKLDQQAQAALQAGDLREPGRTHLEQLARMFAFRDH